MKKEVTLLSAVWSEPRKCQFYAIAPNNEVIYTYQTTEYYYFKSKADKLAFLQGKDVIYSPVIFGEYRVRYTRIITHFGSCSMAWWNL